MGLNQKDIGKKIDALGWALLFIWLGVYFGMNVHREGLFSLGLGSILVFENALRRWAGVRVSRFWLVMGFLFLLVGMLSYFDVSLLPGLLILCGLGILYRYVLRRT